MSLLPELASLQSRINALLVTYGFSRSEWQETEGLLHDTCYFSKNNRNTYLCLSLQGIKEVDGNLTHTYVGANMADRDTLFPVLLNLRVPVEPGHEDVLLEYIRDAIVSIA